MAKPRLTTFSFVEGTEEEEEVFFFWFLGGWGVWSWKKSANEDGTYTELLMCMEVPIPYVNHETS